MGTIIDHAIIVSGDRISVAKAHAKAVEIFPNVTSVANAMNGSGAFMVPPDGSKLGWPESELGCRRRHEFKQWLRAERLSLLEWLEVRFGEIDGNPGVVAGSGVLSDESPTSGEWLPDDELTLIASITIRPSAKTIAEFESVQRLNAAMVSERLAANARRRGDLALEWVSLPLALVLGLAIGWLW